MPRLILLLLIALGIWYGWQYLKSRPPHRRKRLLWVVGTSVVLIASVLLVAMGRMHWLGIAVAAIIPLLKSLSYWLPRAWPLLKHLGAKMEPATFTAPGIKLVFHPGNGTLGGGILAGPLSGRALESLSAEQLQQQLAFFQTNDRKSARLLQAYMLKNGLGGNENSDGKSESVLEEREAWQILGLSPGASQEDIIRAHKQLIQKLHPDRGGNDYLAAKVNAARDKLIGS